MKITEKEKIQRINLLARKAREQGLTPEEKAEQETLRNEYREGFRRNFLIQLDNTVFVDENGCRRKITEGKD